jgi:hypothetical protein
MRSRVARIDFGTSLISGAVGPNVASINTGLYQTQSSCRTAELVGIPEKSRNLRKLRFDNLSSDWGAEGALRPLENASQPRS